MIPWVGTMGGAELLTPLVLILLLFGARRLPGLGPGLERYVGTGAKEILKVATGKDGGDESEEQQRLRNRRSRKQPSPNRGRGEHSVGGGEGNV